MLSMNTKVSDANDMFEPYLHELLLHRSEALARDPVVPSDQLEQAAEATLRLLLTTHVVDLRQRAASVCKLLLQSQIKNTILRWIVERLETGLEPWGLRELAHEPGVVEVILPLLGRPDPVVRRTVMWVLASVAEQDQVQTRILPLLRDKDPYIRLAALNTLGPYAAVPQIRNELLTLVNDGSWCVRAAVAKWMVVNSAQPEVRQAYIPLLDDENWRVVSEAVNVLGGYADSEVQRALPPKLLYADSAMGYLAVYAVQASVRLTPELWSILDAALEHEDHWIGRQAVKALGTHSAEAEVQEVLLRVAMGSDPYHRRDAIEALEQVATHPPVLDQLLLTLKDGDARIQEEVAEVLAKASLSPPRWDLLKQLLGHGTMEVRLVTLRRLRYSISDPLVSSDLLVKHALLVMLKDPEPRVQIEAAKCLEELTGRHDQQVRSAVRDALLSMLKSDGVEARSSAAFAMERPLKSYVSDQNIQVLLVCLLADVKDHIQRYASDALVKVLSRSQVSELQRQVAEYGSNITPETARFLLDNVLSQVKEVDTPDDSSLEVIMQASAADLRQMLRCWSGIKKLSSVRPAPALIKRVGELTYDWRIANQAYKVLKHWREMAASAEG